MNDLAPIAVVTGSASGLGRAIAKRYIEGGYHVAGLDIASGPALDGLTELKVDITNAQQVSDSFRRICELGVLQVLVNAAGIYPRSTLADATDELYRKIFDINVLGTLLVTQQFVANRNSETRGCVVNISSVDGITPFQKSVLYSASKAAVINLTEGIAPELAEKNVRIHGIAPAYIATDRIISLVGDVPADAATPAQVAETCWGLSRPDAIPLVTGQTFITRKGPLDTAR